MRTRPMPALTTGFLVGPALWLASAAALLPAASHASLLVSGQGMSYYAFSEARLSVNAQSGSDFSEASCYCSAFRSYNQPPARGSFANGYAISYYDYRAFVSPMQILGEQTEDAGTISILGSVSVQGIPPFRALASHVGAKPDWSYRFFAIEEVDFTFTYDLVLTGTPLPPTLLIDGVSMLNPGVTAGTVSARLSAGGSHLITLQNGLIFDRFFFVPSDESAGMVMDAHWAITEHITTSVPEPASWAMAFQGLLLVGWAARRKRLGTQWSARHEEV